MGTNTLNDRSDGQKINETWFNGLNTALKGDFVPRNPSGVATDAAGSLGTSVYWWSNLFSKAVKLLGGTKIATISPHATQTADYTLTLPQALPGVPRMLSVTPTGQINADGPPPQKAVTLNGTDPGVGGIAKSSSAGSAITFNNSGYSTLLSTTLTTTGRPVRIYFEAAGTSEGDSAGIVGSSSGSSYLQVLRNGTLVFTATVPVGYEYPASALEYVDNQAAGTYTYTLQGKTFNGTSSVRNMRMVAMEL